jgi:hypothetical protein
MMNITTISDEIISAVVRGDGGRREHRLPLQEPAELAL